ncbi:MBL fold metallo-hydrolase [Pseudogemmobacter blasticus]|uniref:MBL fold hydrolase n=1 Tax=Fuscovulum blasticum DSM 2131 TaxID=1188250 RepID=A0A2T4JF56_FUSBL|nr:MBL fold metallo-hydrolase [Fuscovulum blasticum]PTE16427.1 MBL fold hydrolase [Fuscovulum blasticum DSM 2131]
MANAIYHPFPDPPAEGTATEVASGILWMRLPLPMALDHVNVFALDDGDGWTIVDTGLHSRRTVALWETLLAGPLAGRPVRRLIVTHHHPDHVGLAGWFQARGAELMTTRTAWLYARMLTLDEQPLPTPQALTFLRRAGLSQADLDRRAVERPFNFADVVHPMPVGFTRLTEGQTLRLAGRTWTVRLGSGHAPDHATLWTEGLVLGGDQLLPGISANIGVYPSEPDDDPLADWLESCGRLAAHARDDQLVLPGHKLPFTGLPFRLVQMAENHQSALTRLLDHLAVPRSAVECFPPLFRRDIGPAELSLALAEAVAHINHLLRRGMISRSLTETGAWTWQKTQE